MPQDYEYVYQDTTLVPIPPLSGWGLFADLFGQNPMRGQFRATPGYAWQPGITFDGDSRTGLFQPFPFAIGYSIFGHIRFLVSKDGIGIYNDDGISGTINTELLTTDRTFQLPDASGIIALEDAFSKVNGEAFSIQAGQLVMLDGSSNVKLAQADDFAHHAVGFAKATVGSGDSVYVQTGGLVTLADWTNVLGTTSLTVGVDYFLNPSAAGFITDSPPSTAGMVLQYVGKAVTAQKLLVELERPYQL